MKIIFSFLLLIFSTNSFASEEYCSDKSRRVFYVNFDMSTITKDIASSDVKEADLVANLSDGTAVIVPCFNDRVSSKVGKSVSSLIIDQKNIFIKIKNLKGSLTRAVGLNFESAAVLVEQKNMFFIKTYIVHKSDRLEELKEEKIKRQTDNR